MKSNSKLFEGIRIKPRRGPAEEAAAKPGCDWDGCSNPGIYKAPKGAKAEGQFHNFCLDHVRQYNRSYNFFSNMSDDDIADYVQKANAPGSRETWAFGTNRFGKTNPEPKARATRDYSGRKLNDPLNLFARVARNRARVNPDAPREIRIHEQDRVALETLGLEGRKSSTEIKAAYKGLVKIHHPDANGGDKTSEERLRAIISAYNHLKSKGFV